VYGPAGTGKAQPLDSKIMTINGWKLMGDIELGDLVLGEDGKYSNVSGIFPQGEMEVVKITFEDGRTAECTYNHLWNIYCFDYPEKNRVIDTSELIRKLNKKAYSDRLYVPLVSPNDKTWDNVELLVHPYVLGVILRRMCVKMAQSE
jgi:replicative DNA helicase